MLPRSVLLLALPSVVGGMAFYPVANKKAKTPTRSALLKRSGALTVSVEYSALAAGSVASIDVGEVEGEGRRTVALSPEQRLERLSAALRGGREVTGSDAAAIWTADLGAVAGIAKEQETARGDMPGPCPVVYSGDAAGAEAAIAAGASAVVLGADSLDVAASLGGSEVIWRVESDEDVAAIADANPSDCAHGFVLPASSAAQLFGALPPGAYAIGAIDAMQPDDAELEQGRELAAAGCKTLLLRGACVGDAEDLPYSRYAIKKLTSKKSAAFAIDGHTGAVNGHFGGAAVTGVLSESPEGGWERMRR